MLSNLFAPIQVCTIVAQESSVWWASDLKSSVDVLGEPLVLAAAPGGGQLTGGRRVGVDARHPAADVAVDENGVLLITAVRIDPVVT